MIDVITRLQPKPKAVLISGGGNDIAGEAFAGFLNHASSGLTPLRMNSAREAIEGVKKAYEHIAHQVWTVDPSIAIVTHGYGYPIPDGRAVFNFPFNYRYIGPWLKPALVAKNIVDLGSGKEIVKTMIDLFNDMIEGLSRSLKGPIYYIDLRRVIRSSDWVNELHLNDEAYGRCASKFHEILVSL